MLLYIFMWLYLYTIYIWILKIVRVLRMCLGLYHSQRSIISDTETRKNVWKIFVRHFKLSLGGLYCPSMNVARVKNARKVISEMGKAQNWWVLCWVLLEWLREKQINLLLVIFLIMSPGSHILACHSCRAFLHIINKNYLCYW